MTEPREPPRMRGPAALPVALAGALIAAAAAIVPRARRREWQSEWRAELAHRVAHARRNPGASPTVGLRLLQRTAGCVVHAAWLRLHHWSSTMVWQDLRYAGRLLRRSPGFTAVSAITLALGIGATTAVFSIAYAVLFKPLPYERPDRLVQIWEHNPVRGWVDTVVAPANLADWRARNRTLTGIAAYFGSLDKRAGHNDLTLTGRGEPEMVRSLGVSANFFDVLGAAPAAGRMFSAAEDDGGERVAVLSDGLWRRRFGADRAIVGRTIELNGRPYLVTGVMAPGFSFADSRIELWTPLGIKPSELPRLRRPHFLRTVGRLRDGVTIEHAQADLSSIASALEREHPETNTAMKVGVGPFRRWMVDDVARPLVTFLVCVGFVLLIACVNVTNLLLARATGRAREMAVRSALGAGRLRIVRQLVIEALLISIGGTLLGLALTALALPLFVRFGPALPRAEEIGLDPAVFLASAGIAGLTTIVCGLVPAWHATRPAVMGALRDGARGTTSAAGKARALLVATEVALAVVLVVGAGLLLRSFDNLQRVDAGLTREQALTFRVNLPSARYAKDDEQRNLFNRLFARLEQIPGVRAAGGTSRLPLAGGRWTSDMTMEGRAGDDYGIEVRHKEVSRGFFAAIGLEIQSGRGFLASDRADAPRVVVVNQALERRYFPRGGAVGTRITFGKPTEKDELWRTIVGVVADEPQDQLGAPPRPEVYESIDQNAELQMDVVVRGGLTPAALVPAARSAVRELDPSLVMHEPRALDTLVQDSLRPARFATWLVSLCGLAALMLALIGVYGIVAYAVGQRTQEVGIRLALGAAPGDVVAIVLRRSLGPVLLGLAAGLVLAAAGARVLAHQLFEVRAWDPAVFGAALAVMLAAGLLAALVPARRTLRIDPLAALRSE